MKITKETLKRVIKEEYERMVAEATPPEDPHQLIDAVMSELTSLNRPQEKRFSYQEALESLRKFFRTGEEIPYLDDQILNALHDVKAKHGKEIVHKLNQLAYEHHTTEM